jgi:hypothetical protein
LMAFVSNRGTEYDFAVRSDVASSERDAQLGYVFGEESERR